MRCDRIREAISARIDGEDPGLPAGALDAHLTACAACRGWQQRAHAVTRRARLGGSYLDHDLTPAVLTAVAAARAGDGRRLTLRAGLIAVGAAQLAITVPLLILGHEHDAGVHAAHELGSFNLALAIAFAIGAVRPALSAGLAWPCGIAAGGLAGTAVADLFAGQTFGADEAQHLIAIAGAALLVWQARTSRAGSAGPALQAGQDQARIRSAAAGAEAVARADEPTHSPGGEAATARQNAAARSPAEQVTTSRVTTPRADGGSDGQAVA
jgi:predicted anti-sigma-YlaC factor YlaD